MFLNFEVRPIPDKEHVRSCSLERQLPAPIPIPALKGNHEIAFGIDLRLLMRVKVKVHKVPSRSYDALSYF